MPTALEDSSMDEINTATSQYDRLNLYFKQFQEVPPRPHQHRL